MAANDAWEARDELFDMSRGHVVGDRVDVERRLDVAEAAALVAAGYAEVYPTGASHQLGHRSTSQFFPHNKPTARVAFIRDIFGNPFRPVAADPAWLTPAVRSIAAGIYEGGAFDRLPVLADALQEAGCANADMLLHCRTPAEHVRGCWVVDLVLGKE